MKFTKRIIACAVVAGLTAPMSAMATNGYFSHGYGIKAKGMGGAGIAYGQDAMAAATNPANMVLVGSRFDFGLDIFSPDREANVSGSGADGNYEGNEDNIFLIPEFGYNHMLNDTMSVGLTVFGNGGMNASYNKSFGLFGTSNVRSDLQQLFISPSFSAKVGKKQAFGIALNLIYQTFEVDGLEGFSSFSNSPNNLTNNGKDSSTGFNIRLGWTGELSDKITVGATYQSKADMSDFEDYKGLFAEQGGFDIPETYGIGIAIKATPKVNVVFDIKKINYSDVASIGNPLLPNFGNGVGADDGPGFGWQDMTVYKLGFDWQTSKNLVLRAGWNHGKQPIPESQTMFNFLAPATVEDHLTLGSTLTLQNKSELSFAFMYALENEVNGKNSIPASFGGGEVDLKMQQYSLGVAYGWKF